MSFYTIKEGPKSAQSIYREYAKVGPEGCCCCWWVVA